MIGRQVIVTNKTFTLEELNQFMNKYWDKKLYCDFSVGKPTPASFENYIMLPATKRFMVIAYARNAGGFFNKKNKIILSVCSTPQGAAEMFTSGLPSHSIIYAAWSISNTMSSEKERQGPAEEVLQKYTVYMRELLKQHGYTE